MNKITYQVNQTAGILLNANESPYPLSPARLADIKAVIDQIAFHRYPDDTHAQLKKAYAKYLHINEKQLIIGNGSDEMIGLLIGTQIAKGDCVYTVSPDFSMYDYYTAMNDGIMLKYPCSPDTVFDADDFINYAKQAKVKLVIFSNPNNPSGRCIPQADIVKIIKAFAPCPVAVDEAYAEFADTSMLPMLSQFENLIVLRTMSKAFGMAALRCGCMAGNEALIGKLLPYKVPYNVNSLTQAVATILLSHSEETKQNVAAIIKERERLYKRIIDADLADLTIYPSQANYLYGCSLKKKAFLKALSDKQISIRDYADSDYFRISIGTPEENDLVMEVLLSVFQSKAKQ